VADDNLAVEMLKASTKCASSRVYYRTETGFALVPTGRDNRSNRWAALFENVSPANRVLISGASIGHAVAHISVVSRVVGGVAQCARAPSSSLVEACGLSVSNVTRLNDKTTGMKKCCGVQVADTTAVGDKLVFYVTSTDKPVGVVWW